MQQTEEIRALAASQDGIVTIGQIRRCGVTKSGLETLVRQGDWARIHEGIYVVDFSLMDDVPLRSLVRAGHLLHGPEAVAVLETAARLWGIEGVRPWDGRTVDLAVPSPRGRHQRAAIDLHFWKLDTKDVDTLGGLALTSAGRTVLDLALRLPRARAVSVIDSALHKGLLTHGDLPTLEAAGAGRRGVVRARKYWSLADGRAESSLETRIRLICVDAGIPPEVLQWPVRDRFGALLGYADLAWPSRDVIVEADGEGPHSGPFALFRDRRRQNDLVTSGGRVVVLRFTWKDVSSPGYIVNTIRRALAHAA